MKPRTLTPIALTLGIITTIALNIPNGKNTTPAPLNICEVKNVIDGDTIACSDNLRIRFCGIDAPEIKQPLGLEAKKYLANLITGKKVSANIVDVDLYGRAIAEISTEQNINVEMVRSGYAYHYAQYSKSCPSQSQIIAAEIEAKGNRLGVWADERSIKPWDWRKEKK